MQGSRCTASQESHVTYGLGAPHSGGGRHGDNGTSLFKVFLLCRGIAAQLVRSCQTVTYGFGAPHLGVANMVKGRPSPCMVVT